MQANYWRDAAWHRAVRRDDFAAEQHSGESNVHEARVALGNASASCGDAGITGRQLAESLSWPAVQGLQAGERPADAQRRGHPRLDTQATTAKTRQRPCSPRCTPWKSSTPSGSDLRAGMGPQQNELAELDQKTRLFRAFEPTVIPGLLQTAEYARARFAEGIRVFQLPNDIDDAVRGRVSGKRSCTARTSGSTSCSPRQPCACACARHGHARPARPPGFVLRAAQRAARHHRLRDPVRDSPWHGFWLYDKDRVLVETYSAALNLAQPQEIALYRSVFDELAAAASYGREARAIITRSLTIWRPSCLTRMARSFSGIADSEYF